MTRPTRWLTGLFLVLAAFAANAGVVYDNGVAAVNDAFYSDRGIPLVSADDFALAAGANTINGIRWSGIYAFANTPPATDAFRIEIFADNGGTPADGPPLIAIDVGGGNRADSGVDLVGYDVYSYHAAIAPLTLAANTTFWLSISNDTSADGDDDWFWGAGATPGNSFAGPDEETTWIPIGFNHDFLLTGVPEPATVVLAGLGLAGLGFTAGRRAKRAWPG